MLAVVAALIAGTLIAKVDPRRLVFFGVLWLGAISFWRVTATTDMTYWQIARPLMIMGLGMPFFFVPITVLALGSVDEPETASAAGLMNFLRTLSGAVATSIVTTMWEDRTSERHADLVGMLDRSGDAAHALVASGMPPDVVNGTLDRLLQGQSVMLATNEIMALVAVAFVLSACFVWLAPRPTRSVDMTQAGH